MYLANDFICDTLFRIVLIHSLSNNSGHSKELFSDSRALRPVIIDFAFA